MLEREGVHGKDVTPRLLEYFHDNSGGESLRANVELVLSNARLAGEVAAEIVAQSAGACRPARAHDRTPGRRRR